MSTDQILLQEHKTKESVALASEDLAALRESYLDLQITPAAEPGRFDIRPGSTIGTILMNGRQLVIQPKLDISRVFFLMAYASGLVSWKEDLALLPPQSSLLEALIPIYCAHLDRAFKRGLLQGYRHVDEPLMTIRGRIDFKATIQRFALIPPIDVNYDDFTVDTDENRMLKAAIMALGRLPIRDENSRRGLRRYAVSLADVADMNYATAKLPTFTYTRLNDHYRPALTLARLILLATSLDLGAGEQPVIAFLVDMNKVFEAFVREALRDALRIDFKSFPAAAGGYGLRLDVAGRIRLEPDLSLWRNRRCVFVGDAKYKVTSDGLGPNSDLYQLLAYVVATDLDQGTLIYAKGEAVPVDHDVRFLNRTIRVRAVDLAEEPEAVLRQIGQIAVDIQAAAVQSAA